MWKEWVEQQLEEGTKGEIMAEMVEADEDTGISFSGMTSSSGEGDIHGGEASLGKKPGGSKL